MQQFIARNNGHITINGILVCQNCIYEMCLSVDTQKNLKAIRCNGYRFVPKGGMFPTETITLVVRSSGL